MRSSPFFSRRFDPVLNCRKRDEDSMISPEVPGRWPIGETVLDDQTHGSRDDTVGIAAPRQGEIRHVGVEVLLATRAEMLREPDVEIHWSFRSRVAHVVEDSFHPSVAVSAVVADRACPRSEEHTSELQSRENLVCRLLLEKK